MKVKVRADTKAWDRLRERAKKVKGTQVRIGVFGKETHEGSSLSLVELAAIHEFGSPAANIPERSFIRRTLDAKKDEIKAAIKKAASGVIHGTTTAQRALGIIGHWLASEMKKTITSGPGIPPPLQPETIRRKGSSRPLVNTGQLKNSITSVVVGYENADEASKEAAKEYATREGLAGGGKGEGAE